MTLKPGTYKHAKTGNFYRVLMVGKHSETLDDIVVYQCLYDNPQSQFWIRPLSMFTEMVEINGKSVPRFEFVEN